jgi:hypothetical protein
VAGPTVWSVGYAHDVPVRKRIADLALYERPLDSIIGDGAFEVADQSGGRGLELDATP